MIDRETRGVWTDLDAKLRPFVARRVRSASDVDDVVQNVFLRVQRGLSDLRDDERFGPWVYQVARSAIADHHRRSRRHPIADVEVELDAGADVAAEPTVAQRGDDAEDDRAAEQELAAYVAVFITMLASPYREALTLTELEGLTQKEAARMMGISLSAMKSRVQRGREQLRRALEDCCSIALDARGRVVSCEPRPDGKLPDCLCR